MSGCDDLRVRGEILLAAAYAYAAVMDAQEQVVWATQRYATALRHGAWARDPARVEADAEADLQAAHARLRRALARWDELARDHETWFNRRDDGRRLGVWEVDW